MEPPEQPTPETPKPKANWPLFWAGFIGIPLLSLISTFALRIGNLGFWVGTNMVSGTLCAIALFGLRRSGFAAYLRLAGLSLLFSGVQILVFAAGCAMIVSAIN